MKSQVERRIGVLTNQLTCSTQKEIKQNITNNSLTIDDIHSKLNFGEGEVLSFLHPNGCLEIILNRPKAYNALSQNMIDRLIILFENSKTIGNVKFILLTSNHPKAFCAGGDIKPLTSDSKYASNFFKTEYYLDLFIAQFPKPVVVLINGIVMGGGNGISQYGSHRIGNLENYTFAMPETGIGLYPDVGGCNFLSRYPSNLSIGLYLGLTGNKINCEDALYCGFLTHSVKDKSKLEDLKIKLFNINEINEIDDLLTINELSNSYIKKNIQEINSIFSENSVEKIMEKCKKLNSIFSTKTLDILSKKCPYSLKMTFHLLHYATELTLAELFELEYKVSNKLGNRYDFKEGVRAVVVDKDNKPKWNPELLELISDEEIIKFLKE